MFKSPSPRSETVRAQGIELLTPLVTNGVALSLAAQDAHWNVKGPAFGDLHKFFGEVYKAAQGIVDRVAERIVTLGGVASGLAVLGSKPTPPAPASQDGIAYCESLFALVSAYVAMLTETYEAIEALGLCADANALQDAIEALEKLGWQLAAHTERA